jgi:UDP-N-acetyl-D-mannosaminuronic acid dehydrogenase
VVSRLERSYPLADMRVGLLGMSFKAGSDDTRSSLSYKLKRVLRFKAKQVLCHDPYVNVDPNLVPLETLIEESDLLILSTPHQMYRDLDVDVPIIDVWGILGNGTIL